MARSETPPLSTLRRAPPQRGALGSPIVTMAGEYDVAIAAPLSETFSVAIARDDGDLVVDLIDVSFMDAATVSVLVRAAVFLREHGRVLRLRDPSPCNRRILSICELDSLIEPEVETISVGALESWVAVPPIAAARDGQVMATAAAIIAKEVTTPEVLALFGATPITRRSDAASSRRGRP